MKNNFKILLVILIISTTNQKQCSETTFSDDKKIYQDICPAWSPDGSQIAYYHYSDNKKNANGLYIIDTLGLQKDLLVKGKCYECDWSPDGDQIVYSDGNNIFVYNYHKNNINNITKVDSFLIMPVFSFNGEKIIFSKINYTLLFFEWIINVENFIYSIDTGLKQKLNLNGFGFEWSPIGNEVVYTVLTDSIKFKDGINKFNFDTNTEMLVYKENQDGGLLFKSWSPSGGKIVFEKRRLGEIWLMNSDGSDPHFLVNGMYPSFSPDSKKIVFSQFVGGSTFVLKTINIDGTEIKQITGLGLDVGD